MQRSSPVASTFKIGSRFRDSNHNIASNSAFATTAGPIVLSKHANVNLNFIFAYPSTCFGSLWRLQPKPIRSDCTDFGTGSPLLLLEICASRERNPNLSLLDESHLRKALWVISEYVEVLPPTHFISADFSLSLSAYCM